MDNPLFDPKYIPNDPGGDEDIPNDDAGYDYPDTLTDTTRISSTPSNNTTNSS